MLTVGSLFSGIGGLDLGLERAGCRVIWNSEIDPYASRVLAKHWPHVPNLGDITTIDWSLVETPDLICGGYPCQPFSYAGARSGESDPRHLWPYMRDAIRLLRPRWILLENVPGHLSLGFGRVHGDLAELGYDAVWDCIPAAAVGAPHLRYRVFVVAHTDSPRRQQVPRSAHGDETPHEGRTSQHDHVAERDGQGDGAGPVSDTDVGSGVDQFAAVGGDGGTVPVERLVRVVRRGGGGDDVADPDGVRRDGRTGELGPRRWPEPADRGRPFAVADTVSPSRRRPGDPDNGACGTPLRGGAPQPGGRGRPVADSEPEGHGFDGTPASVEDGDAGDERGGRAVRDPDHWAVEPDVGRVAHGVPSRLDRLRCLGNAVVPQVAEWVGLRIVEADRGGDHA